MNSNVDIFFEARGVIDLREVLKGRGDAVEPALSIIDSELAIARAGVVDWIALDASRRLVIADVEGAPPDDIAARLAEHVRWFAENTAVVRRMYQLWNVDWEAPLRALGIVSAQRAASLGARAPEFAAHRPLVAVDFIVARAVSTRDGRMALVLAPLAEPSPASAAAPGAPRVARAPSSVSRSEEISPAEPSAAGLAVQPAERVFSRNTNTGGTHDRRSQIVRYAGQERVLSREETYRRELGLTQEEFAEFFEGSGALARLEPKGGRESGNGSS